ncbi:hypothetical protein [Belnapia moabensis]|uniref:hypothetical protein n=1 Tax=Belnapia moabensis TaxID=365533 RepID=UPI00316ADF11
MRSGFLEGDFQLPALDEPAQDLIGRAVQVGAQQGLRGELLLGIADQHPADRHDGHAALTPDGGCGADFDLTLAFAVPALDHDWLPARVGAPQHLGQVRKPAALGAGPAGGSGRPGGAGSWSVASSRRRVMLVTS